MATKTATSTRTRSSPRARHGRAAPPQDGTAEKSATSFAERFAEAWTDPTPEALVELLQPDVVLHQPHRPPIRGRDAAMSEFRKLFAWLPDFHGEDFRWATDGDTVFVEWVMTVPLPGRAVRIPAVDRFTVRDGLAQERRVYFDQLQLVTAVLARPSLWPGYFRYRWG